MYFAKCTLYQIASKYVWNTSNYIQNLMKQEWFLLNHHPPPLPAPTWRFFQGWARNCFRQTYREQEFVLSWSPLSRLLCDVSCWWKNSSPDMKYTWVVTTGFAVRIFGAMTRAKSHHQVENNFFRLFLYAFLITSKKLNLHKKYPKMKLYVHCIVDWATWPL